MTALSFYHNRNETNYWVLFQVAILETNLKELKKEYQLQMLSHKMN